MVWHLNWEHLNCCYGNLKVQSPGFMFDISNITGVGALVSGRPVGCVQGVQMPLVLIWRVHQCHHHHHQCRSMKPLWKWLPWLLLAVETTSWSNSAWLWRPPLSNKGWMVLSSHIIPESGLVCATATDIPPPGLETCVPLRHAWAPACPMGWLGSVSVKLQVQVWEAPCWG